MGRINILFPAQMNKNNVKKIQKIIHKTYYKPNKKNNNKIIHQNIKDKNKKN